MKLPSLATLLQYENKNVIRYFCHHHPAFSQDQAKLLFPDLLAWMWLNAFRKTQGRTTYLFGPLLILDKLWHAFILHTQDYYQFCENYFGEYFHHHIEPIYFEHELTQEELTDFLNDSFNYLGEEWINRYFSHLI